MSSVDSEDLTKKQYTISIKTTSKFSGKVGESTNIHRKTGSNFPQDTESVTFI